MPQKPLSHRNFNHDTSGAQRWKDQTPQVLQEAIKAGWDGTATEQQKRLLSNWVTARVHDCSLSHIDLLSAHLAASSGSSSSD